LIILKAFMYPFRV